MDFETLKQNVPFATKRDVFAALRNSPRDWRQALSDLKTEYGEDALLFCCAQAIDSPGFMFTVRYWSILEDLVAPTHPAWPGIQIRIASKTGDLSYVEKVTPELVIALAGEIVPDTDLVKAALKTPFGEFLAGARDIDVAAQVPFQPETASATLADHQELNELFWRALVRRPVDDVNFFAENHLRQSDDAVLRASAILRTRLNARPFSSSEVEWFFDSFQLPPSQATPVDFKWRSGEAVQTEVVDFLRTYLVHRYLSADWIRPLLLELHRDSVPLLRRFINADDWTFVESLATIDPVQELSRLLERSQEQLQELLSKSIVDVELQSGFSDANALAFYTALGWSEPLKAGIQHTIERDPNQEYPDLLDILQDEPTERPYFELYNIVTSDSEWFGDLRRTMNEFWSPTRVNELLILRHQRMRPANYLAAVAHHDDLNVYLRHAVDFVSIDSGHKRLTAELGRLSDSSILEHFMRTHFPEPDSKPNLITKISSLFTQK